MAIVTLLLGLCPHKPKCEFMLFVFFVVCEDTDRGKS